MALNVGEYGDKFYASTNGRDISDNTELELKFEKPDGESVTFNTSSANPVTLGTGDVIIDNTLLEANKYVYRTWANGDLDQSGAWQCQLTYTSATVKYKYDKPFVFVVYPSL